MKVLLFDPKRYKSFRPSTAPLGLMSIATYLNANGHKAVICERTITKQSLKCIIDNHKPDMIGVSVITYCAVKDALEIGAYAKNMGIPVVFGGSMATVLPDLMLESGSVDFVSLGEGEETWLEIAEAFDREEAFDNIKGLAFMKDGRYFRTPDREFSDLSLLPALDWTLINPSDFMQKGFGAKRQMSIYYSKGCIANCSFCYNKAFNKCQRRERPIDLVIDEMKYLINEHGADGFNFTDDLIFINETHATDFAEKMIKKGINSECVSWIGETRIGVLTKQESFDLLYKAGCKNLIFGIETNSPDMQKVLNKKISADKVEATVSMCVNAGIVPLLTFMIGLPGETQDDIKKTVSFARKLDKAFCCFQLFTPIPGTDIFDKLVSQGKLTPPDNIEEYGKITFGEKLVTNISAVPTKDIYTVYRYFKLKEFTYNDKHSNDEQIYKVVVNVLKSMIGMGALNFMLSGIYNAKRLLWLLSFFLHPLIRKKYGLYFK